MQILMLNTPSCGNAVKLVLAPTAGETRWRVLRKESPTFSGRDDPAAFLVHEGSERYLTDSRMLVNGVAYHYCVFGEALPGVWAASAVMAATPSMGFDDGSVDAQEVVRDRLDVTLNNMIQAGRLPLSVQSIPVLSIPFYSQDTPMPVVTVLFGGGSPVAHGLGDQLGSGEGFDGAFESMSGWLQSVSLDVAIWSLNAAERNAMRRGVQAAVAANLGVFGAAGLDLFEVQSVSDSEDVQSMNAPVYQTTMRLGCHVAVGVTERDGVFDDQILVNLKD